jgi:hypothetical protein
VLDIPARARRCVLETALSDVKAFEALVADGRVRRVGTVSVLSVYESPYHYFKLANVEDAMQLWNWDAGR